MRCMRKIQPFLDLTQEFQIGLIPLSDPHTFSCAGNGAAGALSFGAAKLFYEIKVLFLIFCYFLSGLNEIKQN